MYQHIIDQFIQQEALPPGYREDAKTWFLPLLDDLQNLNNRPHSPPLIVGINGAQGTGKSTLAKLLTTLLQANTRKVVNLSLDDFYFGKQHRQRLGDSIHPLLATRGVPGTHDVALLLTILRQLSEANNSQRISLPAFDKASDDNFAQEQCPLVQGPVELIILEGWFVGAAPQTDADISTPLNALEREDDADAAWRQYVNAQLAGSYQQVFNQIDLLIMLQAPGFEQVLSWRSLQEDKLRQRSAHATSSIMNSAQISRFIQHFERLTRHCLQTLPQRADIVFALDQQHRVIHRTDRGH